MTHPHDIAEIIGQACHGFTFDEIDADMIETGPVVTQNGITSFDLDLGNCGHFEVIVKTYTGE